MLSIIVLLPFLGALLAAPFEQRQRAGAAWVAAGSAGLALLMVLSKTPTVMTGQAVENVWSWLPAIGVGVAFRLDGLSYLFSLLILVIGLLVVLYAQYYLSPEEPKGRFYGFLLAFMGAMLGLVLSGNLLQMVMFWEITSLSSFLLIGFWKHLSEARQGARLALLITGGGGLALLGGVLLIGKIVGSFELSVVLVSGELIRNHDLYPVALVLILLGAFTKSAQFPFHFWLPHAMSAPTPVSAYLHSATMVKAGVFLIARLFPALSGTELWVFLVSTTGLVTLLFGAYTALFKHDLKGLLAYSTVSHLGLITLLFGLGTPLGELAAVFHIVNHAIFKASLFMAAGIIDHEAGTRDMRKLNGLFKYMPHTAILAMVAASSMAGVPLLNGFLSKEMFFGETLALGGIGLLTWAVPIAATLGGVFSVAYSARFIHDVFFNGEPINLPKTPHEPPRWMKIPVEVLVGLCLLVGVVPQLVIGPLLHVAAVAVAGGDVLPEYSLAIWHGFNIPLLMSFVALFGGIAVYAMRHRIYAAHDRIFPPVSGKALTEDYLGWLLAFSERLTTALENGSLQRYIAFAIGAALVVGVAPFLGANAVLAHEPLTRAADPVSAVGVLIMAAAGLAAAVCHRQRFLALIPIGIVGLFTALAFARLAAPDLALTQLVVEVATVILLLLVLFYLPQRSPQESSKARRIRDAVLAGLAGLGMALVTWTLLTRPFESISDYFLENAVPLGGGSNVVNVILADFRGFDTLGEAVVLVIAAIGIYAMLHGLHLTVPSRDLDGRPWARDVHPLVLSQMSRPLLPLAVVVAIYLYLRGHGLPGGGFVAGLVVGTVAILQYMANGIMWARERLLPDYRPLLALGVLIAGGTGAASWVFEAPFLSHTFHHVHLPVIGEFELTSAMVFESGIFFAVVGTVMLILAELGQLSLAGKPPPAIVQRTDAD